ncbi:hypothetical protein PAMP_001857 [Pampus punctatissimus]
MSNSGMRKVEGDYIRERSCSGVESLAGEVRCWEGVASLTGVPGKRYSRRSRKLQDVGSVAAGVWAESDVTDEERKSVIILNVVGAWKSKDFTNQCKRSVRCAVICWVIIGLKAAELLPGSSESTVLSQPIFLMVPLDRSAARSILSDTEQATHTVL